MSFAKEDIMAFVDGELDEATAARIAAAALSDPELAARIAAERALRERLSAHFTPQLDEPVPAAWTQMIAAATRETAPRPEATIIDLAAVRAARAGPSPVSRWRAPWIGTAIAASLVLGIFVGTRWQGDGPIAEKRGALVASGALATVLDTQLGADQDGKPIRILGSFRRSSGDYCRVFSGDVAAGIACRDNDSWHLQQLVPGSHVEAGSYRQAASPEAELMAKAQDMAAGSPLDAAQESAAKTRGWR